jgi:hypothetical protein
LYHWLQGSRSPSSIPLRRVCILDSGLGLDRTLDAEPC